MTWVCVEEIDPKPDQVDQNLDDGDRYFVGDRRHTKPGSGT